MRIGSNPAASSARCLVEAAIRLPMQRPRPGKKFAARPVALALAPPVVRAALMRRHHEPPPGQASAARPASFAAARRGHEPLPATASAVRLASLAPAVMTAAARRGHEPLPATASAARLASLAPTVTRQAATTAVASRWTEKSARHRATPQAAVQPRGLTGQPPACDRRQTWEPESPPARLTAVTPQKKRASSGSMPRRSLRRADGLRRCAKPARIERFSQQESVGRQ
jgi:hypothetical protein